MFEGRLVNREKGQYKGYPLDRDEWPAGIEEFHADPYALSDSQRAAVLQLEDALDEAIFEP